MNSFLKFIEEDIETKKTLFSTMPINTKSDIKKYNEKITSFSEKYNEYKMAVKKYIDTKSKSFYVKSDIKNLDKLNENIRKLEHVRFILNPLNSYYEKMGFDNLVYLISNYYDFNFTSLNDIINQFLDKFDLADIKLNADDFDYTCYVNEYMTSFLEAREKKYNGYDKVSEIFEKIYWVNPEIIEHVELNFRKLIRNHEKTFNNYISKLQKEEMESNDIKDYDDCLEKLKKAYLDLNNEDKETITNIIDLAKAGTIDVNNYFEDSKVRTSTYTSMMIDSKYLEDKSAMVNFYENLSKLKLNIEEYSNYIKFLPLIDSFKAAYEKLIPANDKDANKLNSDKNLKGIEKNISDNESKLNKLNKKIFAGKNGIFGIKDTELKQLKIESVKEAKELYGLYKDYDKQYFSNKIFSILNNAMTVSDLLNLYYSFDYFKKMYIKKSFGITSYDEIIKFSNEFDLFSMNSTNIIISGINLFENVDVSKVIMNKYRLYNINLNEENLNPDNLTALLDKIKLMLRINIIENSSTTVEKIWFIAQVEKTNVDKNKKN